MHKSAFLPTPANNCSCKNCCAHGPDGSRDGFVLSTPQEGEKPLATVTAKVGKTTGAISVSFTSKKGDKAKYAVELVWRGTQLFAGHVTRTWKDGKVSYTAYGTAEVK